MGTADFIGLFIVGVMLAYLILGSEHSKRSDSETAVVEMYVRVCPRCGSQDIGLDADNFKGFVQYSGKLFYKCNKCGFISQSFIEMSENAAEDFESIREGDWKKPRGWRFRESKESKRGHSYILYISTGILLYLLFGPVGIALILYALVLYLWRKIN